jgi:hypothetical protein
VRVTEFPGNIIYIEDAFPNSLEFIENIEKFESNPATHEVIPPWEDWYDSKPVKLEGDNPTRWARELQDSSKGKQKLFNWDITTSDSNKVWPRPEYIFEDEAHALVSDTIDLLDKPYREILKVWSEKTGNSQLEYISKNYFLRKYHTNNAIAPHIDKNINNPLNTMDWSILFYLNDDYDGGGIKFTESGIVIKPSAGSALIFPCTTVHEALTVESGEKYYIFMVIHSEFGYSSALGEPYHELNQIILNHKSITNHPLLKYDFTGLGRK